MPMSLKVHYNETVAIFEFCLSNFGDHISGSLTTFLVPFAANQFFTFQIVDSKNPFDPEKTRKDEIQPTKFVT